MKIIRPITSLRQTALQRKPGYLDACRRIGKVTGSGEHEMIEFTREQHSKLRADYALEEPLPPLGTMIKNAAGAAGRAAGAVARGESPVARPETQEQREKICRTSGENGGPCPHLRLSDMRCSLCGCWLNALAGKWKAAEEQCPDNPPRWGKESKIIT